MPTINYQVCFSHSWDLDTYGPATHTIREGMPGHGLPLIPVTGHKMPAGTDLLAVPKRNLVFCQL